MQIAQVKDSQNQIGKVEILIEDLERKIRAVRDSFIRIQLGAIYKVQTQPDRFQINRKT